MRLAPFALLSAALVAAPVAARSAAAQATPPAAAAPATTPAEDERAALAVVQRLFDAMRARDTAALRASFAPGAVLGSSLVRNGQPVVRQDSIGSFVRSIAGAPAGVVLDERIYAPEVRVSDGLASVWVEYDLYLGERFSHCGVDAFHLARTTEGWRIVHLMDTRRTEGCPKR
jgi:hypothetical protein